MTIKDTFFDHAFFALSKGSNWREQQAIRYPDDPRNAVAAQRLFDLAAQTTNVDDQIWNRLRPFFNPKDRHYCEALSRACRDVGFRTNPRDFDDFAQTILDGLAVSA